MNENNRHFSFLCLSENGYYNIDNDMEKMNKFLLQVPFAYSEMKIACYKRLVLNYESIAYLFKNNILISPGGFESIR